MQSIHSYQTTSIEGKPLDLSVFAGRKILIINVASACGYTPQYKQLQELHEHFSDKIAVIGFPCNDFGAQESGSEAAIQEFCTVRFGVTFPLSAKIGIVKNTHPIYQFLTQKALNGVKDSTVKWNFQKYLLNEKGGLIDVFSSSVSPLDDEILGLL
ncbi:MAG: glutathione peroxidase [Saprospiraceae bacterium]|nr:glutathione peroxidase [Saprospiraceae bacterium]